MKLNESLTSKEEVPHDGEQVDEDILVPDWLITSHVTYITSSDWFLPTTHL